MGMKNKIVVIGSSNTDMVMRVSAFPKPGETMLGRSFLQNQGGKGANQAVACARLRGDVAFVAKVGSDALGDNAIRQLSCEQMDVSQVTQTDEQPSGSAFIMVDDQGENSIIVNPGANACLSRRDIDSAECLIADAGFVLMQLESPIDTLIYAAQKAHEYGAMVILNPAPAPPTALPDVLLREVDVLIPNEIELRILSRDIDAQLTIEDCIHKLQQVGVKDIVVTIGSKGAVALIDHQVEHFPSQPVKAVDTTAAGDTFCGALCVALSQGRLLGEAITFACKAAAITVSRTGAQQSIPHIEEIV